MGTTRNTHTDLERSLPTDNGGGVDVRFKETWS